MLFARNGLSSAHISLLFVVWSVTGFAFEVPTGVLADRYSRRHLLALAQLIRAAGYLMWWLVPNFAGFAAGFALWGVQGAMTSGAFQALVFDELHARGESDRYGRIMGVGEAWSSCGSVLGALLAAVAVPLGFPVILIASSVACVVTGAIVLSFPVAIPVEAAVGTRYFQLLREGVREVLSRRALLGFVVFSGAVVGIGAAEEFWGLVLRDAGFDRADISLICAVLFVAAVAGNLVAHRVANASWIRLAGFAALTGITLVATARVPSDVVPVGLLLFQAIYGLQFVALDARLQGMITSRARATVTSVQGFVTELAAIATFVVFGAVATATSNRTATGVVGLGFIVLAVGFATATSRVVLRRRRS